MDSSTNKDDKHPSLGSFRRRFFFLLHEDSFQNQEKDHMFRKVLLFATHPQRMFYQRKMDNSFIQQDRTLEVAVRIADSSIKFNPKYYQTRAWEPVVSVSKKARHIGNPALRALLYSLQDPLDDTLKPSEDVPIAESSIEFDTWSAFFNPKPHSNSKTRSLLPEAIKAIEVDKEEEWKHPSQFHPAVAAWLKGQKEVLFHCGPTSCAEDIVSTVENYKTPVRELAEEMEKGHQIPLPSLKRMLRQLLLAQQKQLGSLKPCKEKTETSNGSSAYIDTCARWTIGNVRPLYVERRPRCLCCERMTGKVGQQFIPKSPDVASINPRRLARFLQSYLNYDRLMQATLLDSCLPTPRTSEYLVAADDVEDFEHNNHEDESMKDCLEEEESESPRRKRKLRAWESQLSLDTFAGTPNPSASESNSLTEVTYRDSSATTETKEQKMRGSLRLPEHAKCLLRLIRDPSDCSHLPTQVEIWYQTCKEHTKVSPRSRYKSQAIG